MYACLYKKCLNGQLRTVRKKNVCEHLQYWKKKKMQFTMWCITRILLIRGLWGWCSNSNPPPTAAGKHYAVCITHLGTLQHINTSSAYRMIRILGAATLCILIGMSIDFTARQLKNASGAIARHSPANFCSSAGPLCEHFLPSETISGETSA